MAPGCRARGFSGTEQPGVSDSGKRSLLATGRPASVIDNGNALAEQPGMAELEASAAGWYYDPSLGSVYVKVVVRTK